MVKNLEFWRPHLEGTSHLGTPKFGQILSFFYIYLPQKFHVSSLKRKKVWILEGLVWGNPPFLLG